jgi:hypothetical protein
MHRVQHFLRHLFWTGVNLLYTSGLDAHQIQDGGLHEFGHEPVRVIGPLNEVDNADVKSRFVARNYQ